jgi:hypothetical protein
MRRILISIVVAAVFLSLAVPAGAAPYDEIMQRWQKTQRFGDAGDALSVSATYFSSEYIEALMQSEADKNLWTADEMDLHKYQLLKTLRLDDTIPVRFRFDIMGSAIHMAPFGEQVTLWIKGKKYKPVDYDPLLNFKVADTAEGMVYFPRFDEKTGKDLLAGAGTIKLELSGSISMTIKRTKVDFIWDVAADDPSRVYSGQAGGRLEMDRLIKRLANLNKEKQECEKRLDELNSEIADIEIRMGELQQQ